MADNVKHVARARRWKRAGIIGACISTVGVIVLVIIAFLPHGSDAFSVRIDNPKDESHFHMALNRPGEGQSEEEKKKDSYDIVRADPIDQMELTTARDVEVFLSENNQILSKSNNFVEEVEGSKRTFALVYTIYLVNESGDAAQKLKYSLNLDGYSKGENNTIDPYRYFRALIQTEDFVNNKSQGKISNTYYGYRHTKYTSTRYEFDENSPYYGKSEYATITNEFGDNREPIAGAYKDFRLDEGKNPIKDKNNREVEYLKSSYYVGEEPGYCINFDEYDENHRAIIPGTEFTIPPGATKRFTFVGYYEGGDPDSYTQYPTNSYLLLSLHFGL